LNDAALLNKSTKLAPIRATIRNIKKENSNINGGLIMSNDWVYLAKLGNSTATVSGIFLTGSALKSAYLYRSICNTIGALIAFALDMPNSNAKYCQISLISYDCAGHISITILI